MGLSRSAYREQSSQGTQGKPCFSTYLKRDESIPFPDLAFFSLDKADFHDLSPAEIRSAAEKVAEAALVVQREEFEMLGVMADWSKEGTYRTLGESTPLLFSFFSLELIRFFDSFDSCRH